MIVGCHVQVDARLVTGALAHLESITAAQSSATLEQLQGRWKLVFGSNGPPFMLYIPVNEVPDVAACRQNDDCGQIPMSKGTSRPHVCRQPLAGYRHRQRYQHHRLGVLHWPALFHVSAAWKRAYAYGCCAKGSLTLQQQACMTKRQRVALQVLWQLQLAGAFRHAVCIQPRPYHSL
jgi:hypothetical protein